MCGSKGRYPIVLELAVESHGPCRFCITSHFVAPRKSSRSFVQHCPWKRRCLCRSPRSRVFVRTIIIIVARCSSFPSTRVLIPCTWRVPYLLNIFGAWQQRRAITLTSVLVVNVFATLRSGHHHNRPPVILPTSAMSQRAVGSMALAPLMVRMKSLTSLAFFFSIMALSSHFETIFSRERVSREHDDFIDNLPFLIHKLHTGLGYLFRPLSSTWVTSTSLPIPTSTQSAKITDLTMPPILRSIVLIVMFTTSFLSESP